MRRAPLVLTGTLAGMVAVLTFRPQEPELRGTLVASSAGSDAPGGATPTSPSVGPAPSASTPSTPSTSSRASGTATGDVIDTRYGPAQVRVTVQTGRITKVEAVQLQSNDPKSVQISSYAAPILAQSALTKQSGDLDAVSGATITSVSYEASLQSALDKLGFSASDGSRGTTDQSAISQAQEQSHGGHHGGDGEAGGVPPGPPPGGWR